MLGMILYKSVFLFLRLWKFITRHSNLFGALYCDVLLFESLMYDGVTSDTSEESGSEITLLQCDDIDFLF